MPKCPPYSTPRFPEEQRAMDDFARAVLDEMHRQGINRMELARRIGCDPSRLSITLNGGHAPRLTKMVEIAQGLGMRLEITLRPQ